MPSGFADSVIKDLISLVPAGRDELALQVFQYQYQHNSLYHAYCNLRNVDIKKVKHPQDIPFLPISFFKTHTVHTTAFKPEIIFESSGTTGDQTSRHELKNAELYRRVSTEAFTKKYGPLENYCILGLLPSYLQKGNSSLVYMVNHFMEISGHPGNGFYLDDWQALNQQLKENENAGQPTILFGVAYALLDFAAAFPQQLRHTHIIETGGMKGRKKEITRQELHATLCSQLGIDEICSEYGMTELLSQFYAQANGVFTAPPWAQVYCRAEDDPCDLSPTRGAANIIDLANIYSCAFIATDDAAILHDDGSFEITGRLDKSDIRGCSLLML